MLDHIEARLRKGDRAAQLRFMAGAVQELTLAGRDVYDAEPASAVDRLKEVNEAVHRLSGYLSHLLWTDGEVTPSGVDLIMEAIRGFTPDGLRRAMTWFDPVH